MKRVLFICTRNSARSQIAEGLVNYDLAGRFEAFSAGTEPSFVNPLAISVMKELGIDISQKRSKGLNESFRFSPRTSAVVSAASFFLTPPALYSLSPPGKFYLNLA